MITFKLQELQTFNSLKSFIFFTSEADAGPN